MTRFRPCTHLAFWRWALVGPHTPTPSSLLLNMSNPPPYSGNDTDPSSDDETHRSHLRANGVDLTRIRVRPPHPLLPPFLFPLARPRIDKLPCLLPLPVCSRRRATSSRWLGQAVRPKVRSLQSSLCLPFPPKLRSRSHTPSSLFTLRPPLSALNTISTSTPRPTHPDRSGRTLSTTRPLSRPSLTRTGTNTPPPTFPRLTRTGGNSNTNPSRRSTSLPLPTDRLRGRSFWLIKVGNTRRSALGIRSRRS